MRLQVGAIALRLYPFRYNESVAAAKAAVLGFGSAAVLEIVEDWRGNTYRAVYTVRFAKAVYVLHVFQKKAKQGIATPKPDMDLIRDRLKAARRIDEELR